LSERSLIPVGFFVSGVQTATLACLRVKLSSFSLSLKDSLDGKSKDWESIRGVDEGSSRRRSGNSGSSICSRRRSLVISRSESSAMIGAFKMGFRLRGWEFKVMFWRYEKGGDGGYIE